MKPTPVPFGEWRPDIALLDTQFASEVENVFAGINSYLPFPSLQAFSLGSLVNAGNDENTMVLLQFDTDTTDYGVGGAGHTWTLAGNAAIDTTTWRYGTGSLTLDGAGDYVSTPAHADWAFGSGDFTIELWCLITGGADGVARALIGQGDAAATPSATSFRIFRWGGNTIVAQVSDGTAFHEITGTTQITVGNAGWHHVAFVRSGLVLKLFVNGVQEGGDLPFAGTLPVSPYALVVGRMGEFVLPGPGGDWWGNIDSVRLSNVARWTADFTPPPVAFFDAGGKPCGVYTARAKDGSWKIFAGTTTKLFSWSLDGFVDISRTTVGPYAVPPNDLWMWEQSGEHVIAVNENDYPQWLDVNAPAGRFEALPGNPPKATNVKQIGDFLFLSGLVENPTPDVGDFPIPTTKRDIIWSSVNDITAYVPGVNLCDMQRFPDCGIVQGVVGSEIGYVVQDRGVRTMQFLPGDTTFIFNFSKVLHDRGSVSKYGFCSIGNVLYLVTEDGFYSMSGQQVIPIGSDKVNNWFLANSDVGRKNVVHAIAGVNKPRVVWAYYGSEGSQTYDKLILFDWSNQRWAKASERAHVWGLLASAGLDLDTDAPGDLEDIGLDTDARALDSFAYVGGRPLIGGIDPAGHLAAITGPNLPALLETVELHLVPGRRAFVNEAYPLDDATSTDVSPKGTVAAGIRESLQEGPPVWLDPVPIERTGSAALFSSSRLHRFRRSIPAATEWTHAQGVLVEAQQDGDI